jgi:excisionase family DNA binding protein
LQHFGGRFLLLGVNPLQDVTCYLDFVTLRNYYSEDMVRKEELLDLITVTEAARVREVSHQAILNLVQRGRLTSIELGGRKFLRRSEVVNFEALPGGRPAKKAASKKKGSKK